MMKNKMINVKGVNVLIIDKVTNYNNPIEFGVHIDSVFFPPTGYEKPAKISNFELYTVEQTNLTSFSSRILYIIINRFISYSKIILR